MLMIPSRGLTPNNTNKNYLQTMKTLLTFIWIRLNDITYSCNFDNKIKFMSIEGTNSLT